jgi:nitrous oxidase accessory protein NosD
MRSIFFRLFGCLIAASLALVACAPTVTPTVAAPTQPYEITGTYEGKLVVLANGFHKKTQKTPKSEIEKALKIKQEYETAK